MTVITELASMKTAGSVPEGSVFLLGHFDGVHLGHRALCEEARLLSDRICSGSGRRPSVAVWTLRGLDRGGALTLNGEKLRLFSLLGADYALTRDFSDVRSLDGEEFFRSFLEDWRPAGVVCGYNFTFGRGAACGAEDLSRMAREAGIACSVVPAFKKDGREVSSTEIRRLVSEGRMKEAAELSGRPYFVSGTVRHGHRIGHEIGWPTVNLRIPAGKLVPPFGVYASVVRWQTPDGPVSPPTPGVSNLGSRPTVNGDREDVTLETHLFCDPGELYGAEAAVWLWDFLRPETRFDSLDELRSAIGKDADAAALSSESCLKRYEHELSL